MPWISKNRLAYLEALEKRTEMYRKRASRMHRRSQKIESDLIKMSKAFGIMTKWVRPMYRHEYNKLVDE
jgi:hypothetical protein